MKVTFSHLLILVLLGSYRTGYADPPIFSVPQFRVGDTPAHLVGGDFNADGKQDIAVCNYSSNDVSLLFGQGDLTFAPPISYPVSMGPGSIFSADFNRDGHPDLLTANAGNNTVSILRNNGDGTFSAAVHYPISGPPWGLAVSDVNGDAIPDVLVATPTGSLDFLRGTGNGAFQVSSQAIAMECTSIATGDFNSDHKPDIALAFPYADKVSVRMGVGDGTFGTPVDYPAPPRPYVLTVGDVNADGRADLLVNNGTISMRLGRGDGSFDPAINWATGYYQTNDVQLRDMDSDGDLDILTISYEAKAVILKNNGTGNFATRKTVQIVPRSEPITTTDLDRDGKPEIVQVGYTRNLISVLKNGGNLNFAGVDTFPLLAGAELVATGDFSGDGNSDIIFTADQMDLTVVHGSGYGYFWNPVTSQGRGHSLVVANFDGDNLPDVAIADVFNRVNLMLNFRDSKFRAPITVYYGNSPAVLGAGDVNNDGICDIVTANAQTHTISVLLNNIYSVFAKIGDYPTGNTPNAIALGDLNGDGNVDVVTTNSGDNSVSVLFGNGDGTFQLPVSTPLNFAVSAVTLGDLNADSRPDVVVSGSRVQVLLNAGAGLLLAGASYESPNALSLGIADFNMDGKLDVVTVNAVQNNVSLFLGNGDGTLQTPQLYALLPDPTHDDYLTASLGIADFDSNGSPDIVCSGSVLGDLSLLYNRYPLPRAVSGTITLEGISPTASEQWLTFTFRPASGQPIVRVRPVAPNGTFSFTDIPMGNYTLHIAGPKYLTANVTVNAFSGDVTGITATLKAGDANNDNVVDVFDLDALIRAFDSVFGDSNWNAWADFNFDYSVDVLDLDLLIRNFDAEGEP